MHLITTGLSGLVLKRSQCMSAATKPTSTRMQLTTSSLSCQKVAGQGLLGQAAFYIGYMRSFVGLPVYVCL